MLNLLGCCVGMRTTSLYNLPHDLGVDLSSTHALHHRQVLQVIVGLEQGVSREELNQYAPNAPDIAREAPSQVEYNLGGTVVPRRHDRRVVFIVKGRRAKIDQPDLAIEEYSPLALHAVRSVGGGWDVAVVSECLVGAVHQEDVLRLQIGVDQVDVMKD